MHTDVPACDMSQCWAGSGSVKRVNGGCKSSLAELSCSGRDVGELRVGQGIKAEPGPFAQEEAQEQALRLIS